MKESIFILTRSALVIVALLVAFFVSQWLSAMLFSDNMVVFICMNSVILLLLGFLCVYVLYRFIDKELMRSLGLSVRGHAGEFWQGAIMATVAITLGFVLLVLVKSIRVESTQFRVDYIFVLAFSLLLDAYFEELVLRGYLLRVLAKKTKNSFLALTVSSFVFAFIHLFNYGIEALSILNIVLAGFVLGLLYLRTKNLLLPAGFHFFWNFLQAMLGFNVSGEEMPSILILQRNVDTIINGGEFGFENSIVCTCLLLICLVIFAAIHLRRR